MVKVPLLLTGNERMLVVNKLGGELGNKRDRQSNEGDIIFLIIQRGELWRQNEELNLDLHAFKVSTSSLLHHMNYSLYKIVAALARVSTEQKKVK